MRNKVILILFSLLSSGANAGYYKDVYDASHLDTSRTYKDKFVAERQKTLAENKNRPTLPTMQYISGTIQPSRKVDTQTSGIDYPQGNIYDKSPYTVDGILDQVYIPISDMAGSPKNMILSLKGNVRYARQFSMNFGAEKWAGSDGVFYNSQSRFNYRFDGLEVYAELTDQKEDISTALSSSNKKNISSELGYEEQQVSLIDNNTGLPPLKNIMNERDTPIVSIRPAIHGFIPNTDSNGANPYNGGFAMQHAPFFQKKRSPVEYQNAPIFFTGGFLLKRVTTDSNDLNYKFKSPQEIRYTTKRPKYLRLVFYVRDGVRFHNYGKYDMPTDHPFNVEMNRRIAQECSEIDKSINYKPEYQSRYQSFAQMSVLASTFNYQDTYKDKKWHICGRKRVEIFPLNYEIIIS